MNLTIMPGKLAGTVTPPPSKSQAHRLIIAASLARGISTISNVACSQDIEATIACMAKLGAEFTRTDNALSVWGIGAGGTPPEKRINLPRLDCGESGSTLRFLIPVALAVRGGGIFTGRGRLMERPQKPYFDLFDQYGISCRQEDGSITLRGQLTPGTYALPGNVSSQFVTGLLFALPLLGGDSSIVLTSPLESRGYVDMTLDTLEQARIRVYEEGNTFRIPGGQVYQSGDSVTEADWSQAAFWYAAYSLRNDVEIEGLNYESAQGDRVTIPYMIQLRGLGDVELDVSQCPDLVPALAVRAALRDGQTTRIVNAARLRIKESDRLDTVAAELNKLGADVTQGPDFLTIRGVGSLHGGTVDSHNDHRIAMMLAIAATRADGPVTLLDAGSVAKSYPNFWEEYTRLGGRVKYL